jgi:hypothetical protein
VTVIQLQVQRIEELLNIAAVIECVDDDGRQPMEPRGAQHQWDEKVDVIMG